MEERKWPDMTPKKSVRITGFIDRLLCGVTITQEIFLDLMLNCGYTWDEKIQAWTHPKGQL